MRFKPFPWPGTRALRLGLGPGTEVFGCPALRNSSKPLTDAPAQKGARRWSGRFLCESSTLTIAQHTPRANPRMIHRQKVLSRAGDAMNDMICRGRLDGGQPRRGTRGALLRRQLRDQNAATRRRSGVLPAPILQDVRAGLGRIASPEGRGRDVLGTCLSEGRFIPTRRRIHRGPRARRRPRAGPGNGYPAVRSSPWEPGMGSALEPEHTPCFTPCRARRCFVQKVPCTSSP